MRLDLPGSSALVLDRNAFLRYSIVTCGPVQTNGGKSRQCRSKKGSEVTNAKIEGVSIRTATEQDAGLILTFIKDLAAYEKLSHEVVATEELLKQTLLGRQHAAEVLIADYQGSPAGFALFFHNFSSFLGRPGIYIEDLYIHPHMRGKGIGKNLLAYIAYLATERGCGRVEWRVLDWNRPAIEFYRSLGAEAMDEWTGFRLTGEALAETARQMQS